MIQAGFARIAAGLADPAREAMLVALADGRALPAGELARIAGLSPQSASAHLQKLLDAGLLSVLSQGRFRYYRIADDEAAAAIEALARLAGKQRSTDGRHARIPREICFARQCYDHLAGELGVALADALERTGYIRTAGDRIELMPAGASWLAEMGIVPGRPRASRVDLRRCLDWTERKPHFAGTVPAAILRHLLLRGYLVRPDHQRALRLTPSGRNWFAQLGIFPGPTSGSPHAESHRPTEQPRLVASPSP